MTSPEILAAEMFRVLKPGGRLVLSTPNSAFLALPRARHDRFYRERAAAPQALSGSSQRRSLLKLLKTAGFQPPAALTGRNMYLIVPALPGPLGAVVAEARLDPRRAASAPASISGTCRTKQSFYNALFADCLIMVMGKAARRLTVVRNGRRNAALAVEAVRCVAALVERQIDRNGAAAMHAAHFDQQRGLRAVEIFPRLRATSGDSASPP